MLKASLLDLRRERGLTIRETGVDQAFYVSLEHGRRLPGPNALKKLAKAFSLAPETLWRACQETCRASAARAKRRCHAPTRTARSRA